MILFRASERGATSFGRLTSWTPQRAHAERYTAMRGFGGPVIYQATVEPEADKVLDMRQDPADALASLGLDLDDYTDPLHDLARALVNTLNACGYEWVVFAEGPPGEGEEWLYLGHAPIEVRTDVRST